MSVPFFARDQLLDHQAYNNYTLTESVQLNVRTFPVFFLIHEWFVDKEVKEIAIWAGN